MPQIEKKYIVKVFGQDGTSLKAILTTDRILAGTGMYVKKTPDFKTQINKGQGELVLDLKAKFDSFQEGTTVTFMNIVKVYSVVTDNTVSPITQTQTLIYTGYISRYEAYIDAAGDEGVRVTCLGLISLLSRSYYKNGSSFTVTQSSQDPTVVGKAIIDHFNTIFGGSLISYDSSSVPATVGTNITYTYTDQKWIDALTTTVKLAGTNWWWAVREDGKFYMQAKPGSATHRFVIGTHVVSISGLKDAEKVINDVQVRRTGGTATNYSDATSQSTYGTGGTPSGKNSEVISDSNIADATTADQRGNKEIADKKDSKLTGTVTISPKYNIDSIHVGDTCSIFNYDKNSSFFPTNMLIMGVSYHGDTVDLELEQITQDFGVELNRFVNPTTSI